MDKELPRCQGYPISRSWAFPGRGEECCTDRGTRRPSDWQHLDGAKGASQRSVALDHRNRRILEETEIPRAGGGLVTAVSTQLPVDVLEVGAHGVVADE